MVDTSQSIFFGLERSSGSRRKREDTRQDREGLYKNR